MAIDNKLTDDFLQGIKNIEPELNQLGFKAGSVEKKGVAYFIEYGRRNVAIEFMFGPADWDVEIFIRTQERKFAFKDLLEIPTISDWVADHRYTRQNGRSVEAELHWYMELLKVSLPVVGE